MATADPIVEDNYELELSRVRNKIITTFREFSECLKKREQVLLKELDDILGCYHSYKLEIEEMREKKTALEHLLDCTTTQCYFHIQNIHWIFSHRLNTELPTPTSPNLYIILPESSNTLTQLLPVSATKMLPVVLSTVTARGP